MNTIRTAQYSTIYDSEHRGSLAMEELRGIVKYRELVFQIVRRDVISRYKRSVLGVAWTMLNPLGMMLILTLVFSRLFHSIQGYPVYILGGLVAWTFFSQTTMAALNQNIWGGSLLNRIYLPRTTFTVSALGTGLVNIFFSLIPLALIMIITGFPFRLSLLFLPVSILLLAMFTLGFSLLFSTLAVYFPDVVEMFHVILTAWMYLTPIIYPLDILPQTLRFLVQTFNPMYYLVEIVRSPIYNGTVPTFSVFLPGGIIAIVTLALGWIVFTWKANELTYRT
jgi:ABC-type polysaccharide/polyol phosphate export permease